MSIEPRAPYRLQYPPDIQVRNLTSTGPVRYVSFLTGRPVLLRQVRGAPARDPPETIAEHVRERRVSLGLTQGEAAALIGLTRDGLAKWEMGLREPGYTRTPAVIAFLGYNPEPAGETFAALIKRSRRQLGLSQGLFSRAIDVPVDTLRLWEQAKSRPTRSRTGSVVRQIESVLASDLRQAREQPER